MPRVELCDMELDHKIDNGLMFKPVGEGVEVPHTIEFEGRFWELLCLDPDGRACYYAG